VYNRFFGFKERPFKLVPNPEYLYLSRIHEEVLAHLNYAVGYGEGFVEITGEVGTGKTTLCRMFLENLDENTEAAYIFNPKLDALQLLKAINDEFGIPSDTESVKALIDRFNAFLLEKKAQGKQVILLVDEAQNLSADVLEQLRLLSNLETTTSKLLQIILVGQPELGALLETDALRQLNQRITLSCHLIPLGISETREYIRHRLHIASRKPGVIFTASAHRSIFKYTGGVPRLINIACDRALLTAFTLGKQRISNDIVKRALRELDGKRGHVQATRYRGKTIIWFSAALAALVVGLAVGYLVSNHNRGFSLEPTTHHKIELPTPPSKTEAAEKPLLKVAGLPSPPRSLTSPPEEATAAPPTAATSRTPSVDLEPLITAMDTRASRSGALKAALIAWDSPQALDPGPVDVVDDDVFFRSAARHNALEVLRVQGNLNLIGKLNLPAILEFTAQDGRGSRFLTVLSLGEDAILTSDGEALFSISPASLAGLWTGVAHIFWKNYYNYQGVIPISSPGEVILSLKVHLKALGFPIPEMTAAYDTTTRHAVEVIQARHGLAVDGMVGPLTKIALYNDDPSLDIPRLAVAPHGG
jgi:general secretion pathway protein A